MGILMTDGMTAIMGPEAETAAEAADVRYLDAGSLLFSKDGAQLRLEIPDDRCYLRVSVVRVFPLSDPNRYLSVRDGDNKEVGLIVNPGDLLPECQKLIAQELDRRYIVPVIRRVKSLKDRFGIIDWEVETSRGLHTFTTRNPRENCIMLSPTRFLITDVDGNRYEITDLSAVDPTGILLRYL